MHMGENNITFNNQFQRHEFSEVRQKKILVTLSVTPKMSDQCTAAREKANLMLGSMARKFDCKSSELMKRFYTTFVRLHLEYDVQFFHRIT